MMPRQSFLRHFRLFAQKYAELSEKHPHKLAAATAVGVMGSADFICQKTIHNADGSGSLDYGRLAGVSIFAGWHYGGPCKWLYLKYDQVIPQLVASARAAARKVSQGIGNEIGNATNVARRAAHPAQAGLMVSSFNGSSGHNTGGVLKRSFSTSLASANTGPRQKAVLALGKLLGSVPARYRAVTMMVFVDVWLHTPLLLVPTFYLITGLTKNGLDFAGLQASVAQLRREWLAASLGSVAFWTPMSSANFAFIPQHSRILFVTAAGFGHKFWLSYWSNEEEHLRRKMRPAAQPLQLASGLESQQVSTEIEKTDARRSVSAEASVSPTSEPLMVSMVSTEAQQNIPPKRSVGSNQYGTGVASRVPLRVLYNDSTTYSSGVSYNWHAAASASFGNPQDGVTSSSMHLGNLRNSVSPRAEKGERRVSFGF